MKKYISVVLILALAVLCFTGCMSGEDKIIINEDGSGQSYSRIVMEKAIVDQMLQSFGMTLDDLEMGEARVETVDGTESYVMEETVDFSDYAALKALKDLTIPAFMLRRTACGLCSVPVCRKRMLPLWKKWALIWVIL